MPNTQALREVTTLPHEVVTPADGSFEDTRNILDKIIIHTETVPQIANDGGSPSSHIHGGTHYLITLDGKIKAVVPESKTAYHSNNIFVDQTSLSILHEDGGDPKGERTDELYHAASILVYDLCKFYGIEISRTRVMRHSEVSLRGSSCPDGLDVDRIVSGAKAIDAEDAGTVDKVVAELSKNEAERNFKLYEEAMDRLKTKDERIIVLEKEVKRLENENTGIKKQLKQTLDSNGRLSGELQAKNEEDSTAIDNGLKAEEERNALADQMEMIADALGTEPIMKKMLVRISDLLDRENKLARETTSFFQNLFKRKEVIKNG